MSNLMSRITQWMHDPFGKEDIRRHETVIETLRETTARAHEAKVTLVQAHEMKFPVGHMIGSSQYPHSRRARRR